MDSLRCEIERVDSDIVELLSKRAEISREIGLVKRKNGLRVRDKAREKVVIGRFEKEAKLLEVNPRLARRISQLLIEDSVRAQEAYEPGRLMGKSALVVGGAGRIGEWTCRFLSDRGAEVKVWDERRKLAGYPSVGFPRNGAGSSDIVVIASPLGTSSEDLRRVIEESPKGLVFDLCSVKSQIAAQLRRAAKRFMVSSAHPMFGPSAISPRGKNVVVCDCGNKKANERIAKLFTDAGAVVSTIPLERHDELMAYVLGLSHLCTLLFSRTIAVSGKSLDELSSVQGPSFERMCQMARELSNESKRVYHDIQTLNPHTKKLISTMEIVLGELRKASLDLDPSSFTRIMESSRDYLEVQ